MPRESLGEKMTGEAGGAEPGEYIRQRVPLEVVRRVRLVSRGPPCQKQGPGGETHGSSGHRTL